MYFGFQKIQLRYADHLVIDGLTAEFEKGRISTIIGQNGCGKSSLLKTVSRTVRPSGGEVIFKDRPLAKYPPKELARQIAYLPQTRVSLSDLDVRTLVSYGRYPHRRDRDRRDSCRQDSNGRDGRDLGQRRRERDSEVIDRILRRTGLESIQNREVRTLSGGEAQRAWLAMTLCQEPELLILDEPTSHLDIGYQVELLELIQNLNRELGITIVMVLHDLNLAARYSDWIYAIRDGRLYAKGTPREMMTARLLRDLFRVEAGIYEDDRNGCPYFIPFGTSKGGEEE